MQCFVQWGPAIAQRNLLEEEDAEPVNLFESLSQWAWYHDVKICGSVPISRSHKDSRPNPNDQRQLIRIFKMFLKSAVAEDTLHSVSTDKLDVQEGVWVKLLGEVFRGKIKSIIYGHGR